MTLAGAGLDAVRDVGAPCVPLTVGNLARHLERLSAGSRAAAQATANAADPQPKGFRDLPATIEALILRDTFRAAGYTLRSWLDLSLINK